MRKETVEVMIKNDGSGEMKIETKGFKGASCNDIKKVEAQLGRITNSEATKEMHQYRIPDPVFNGLTR